MTKKLVTLLALGAFVGCADPVETPSSVDTDESEVVAGEATTALGASGKPILKIGTEGLYAPYNFCGTVAAPITCAAPADVQGFDIDVAKAVCEQIGYECQFVLNDWTTMFKNLKKNKYRAVFAAAGHTAERAETGRYTISYEPMENAAQGAHFFALSSTPGLVFTPTGLAGKTIGVQVGTLHEAHLQAKFATSTIVTFPTQADLNAALLGGAVAAVLANDDVMAPVVAANPSVVPSPGAALVYGEGGFLTGNIYALVSFKLKGDPLLYDKINNAILKLHLNGYIKARHNFWVPPT